MSDTATPPPPGPDVEVTPCPLCGDPRTRPLAPGDGWAMGRCKGCGLVRQNPRVTAAWIRAQAYDVERPGTPAPRRSRSLQGAGLEAWETKPQGAFEASVAAAAARLPPGEPRGLWLDVGCQTGGLLRAAAAAGFGAAGCDVDAGSARLAAALPGFDARAGSLAEAGFPAGCAQVVSYRQVLEHVHDLGAELREARRVLAPDGLLLVEVPHQGGVRARLAGLRAALGRLPRRRLFHNVPQHLFYFRARDLARLLRQHGFEVASASTYGRYRAGRGALRAAYDGLRDRLRLGNKLRVLARPSGPAVVHAGPGDWERVRALRLRALTADPDAFGMTLAQEQGKTPEAWRTRLESPAAATFLGVLDGRDAGLAVGSVYEGAADAAGLYAMWVAPEARGRGVGDALVGAVLRWARARGARRVLLDVGDANAPAQRLYARNGFTPTGVTGVVSPDRPHVKEHQRVHAFGPGPRPGEQRGG